MLLLPLLYLALIAAVGYLVYLHAVNDTAILTSGRVGTGRGAIMRIAVYAAPIVAGCTLILFMIKPLFARPVRRSNPYTLEPGQEPLLYSFVDAVAKTVGAPSPSIIEVNCEVNAAAGFRRGFLSLFTNDLKLVIGLPLIAGFNTRQLAGVIAHELGHFSQSVGMRLTYIIRCLNLWFARIVYERDAWDVKLWELSHSHDSLLFQLTFMLARLCVWISRGILWVFMMISHGLSCFMLRQMEFNADRYETRVAGSDSFESTSRRLQELSATAGYLHHRLSDFHAAGRLGDDLPTFLINTVSQMPAPVRTALDKELKQGKTHLFDTHPSVRERIEHALREPTPGVFRLEKPSSMLLRNYAVLCKWTTIGYYHGALGEHIKAEQLVPVEGVVKDEKIADAGRQSIERYFRGLLSPARPLFLSERELKPASRPADDLHTLRAARQKAHASVPAAKEALKKLEHADELLEDIHAARGILAAGGKATAPRLKIGTVTRERLDHAESSIQREQQEAIRQLEPFEQATRERLNCSVRLLQCKDVTAKIEGGEKLLKHVRQILPALRAIDHAQNLVLATRRDLALLAELGKSLSGGSPSEKLVSKLKTVVRDLHASLSRLRSDFAAHQHPLQHSGQELTIGNFLVATVPPLDEIGDIAQAAADALNRLLMLYVQLMGRLVIVAERVEKAMGLAEKPPASKVPTLATSQA